MKSIGDQLFSDPRVNQAKLLLQEALAEHQRHITGVKPPDPDLSLHYEQVVRHFESARGGRLYYPYLGSGIGRGPLVELADGSIKYDMIGGIGVHVLGHSHRALLESSIDAALRDTVMQGNLQQNIESAQLVEALLDLTSQNGANLSHCYLTTSGATANENALKIVLQKNHPASRVLSFEGCFLGRTTTLAQITDKPAFRLGLPTTWPVDYVPFYDPRRPDESTEAAVRILKRHLARYPGQHAAMFFELVLGEGGYYPGHRQFFVGLMEVLRTSAVAIVVDEVQTFGRTPSPLAFQYFGLDEYVNIVTIGKLSQVCATLVDGAYRPQPGLVSQTFTASTSAIFAAHVIIHELTSGDYFGPGGRIERLHERWVDRLMRLSERHKIAGPFGIGAMVAFTVFDGDAKKTKQLLDRLFDAGVIAFMAGSDPARVRMLPPIGVTTENDLDNVASILDECLSLGQSLSGN